MISHLRHSLTLSQIQRVSLQLKYQKSVHIDKVASVKWMSCWKIWTSEAVSHHCSDTQSDEELTHDHLVV